MVLPMIQGVSKASMVGSSTETSAPAVSESPSSTVCAVVSSSLPVGGAAAVSAAADASSASIEVWAAHVSLVSGGFDADDGTLSLAWVAAWGAGRGPPPPWVQFSRDSPKSGCLVVLAGLERGSDGALSGGGPFWIGPKSAF